MDSINQKEYLKKYLGIGKLPGEKKKKKKLKGVGNRVKIIDDDADITISNNIIEDELQNEDAPQIVAIIDERPPSLRVDEKTKNPLWQPIGTIDSIHSSDQKQMITAFKIASKSNDKQFTQPTDRPLSKKKQVKSDDYSPPRKSIVIDDDSPSTTHQRDVSPSSDASPPRKPKKEDTSNDISPPRRRRNDDYSPPRKSRSVDHSPPRKYRNEDISHPRRRRKNNDVSPPRKTRNDDSSSSRKPKNDDFSPPRRRQKGISPPRKRRNEDISPLRRPKSIDGSSSRKSRIEDISPPRKSKNGDISSPMRRNDRSPSRRRDRSRNNDKEDRKKRESSLEKSTKKMDKTLDGKTAGLQNAKELVEETHQLRQREDQLFKNLSKEQTGENAETVFRDRNSGKIRNLEEEEERKRKKREEEEKSKEKYSRWGRGLVQVENRDQKIQEEIYEMSKPLARYADDEDLERFLKEKEREGDPMLQYLRNKKRKKAADAGIATKPEFEGNFMPNRFGIKPGHRWDGVDRSNGYEKRWFEVQNAKTAQQEDVYKWSTEDM